MSNHARRGRRVKLLGVGKLPRLESRGWAVPVLPDTSTTDLLSSDWEPCQPVYCPPLEEIEIRSRDWTVDDV